MTNIIHKDSTRDGLLVNLGRHNDLSRMTDRCLTRGLVRLQESEKGIIALLRSRHNPGQGRVCCAPC